MVLDDDRVFNGLCAGPLVNIATAMAASRIRYKTLLKRISSIDLGFCLAVFVSLFNEVLVRISLCREKRTCGLNDHSLCIPTWVREPEPVGLGESVQFDIRPGVVPVALTRVGRQDVCHGQNEAEQPRDYYRSDHLEETMSMAD